MTSMVLFEEFQSAGTVQLVPEVRKVVTADCGVDEHSHAVPLETRVLPSGHVGMIGIAFQLPPLRLNSIDPALSLMP